MHDEFPSREEIGAIQATREDCSLAEFVDCLLNRGGFVRSGDHQLAAALMQMLRQFVADCTTPWVGDVQHR